MPHPDAEHSLRVQLATALKERDEAKSRAADMQAANIGIAKRMEETLANLREKDRLAEAFMRLLDVLESAREACSAQLLFCSGAFDEVRALAAPADAEKPR